MASSKVTLKKQGLSRFSLLILMLAFGTVGAFFISRSFALQQTWVRKGSLSYAPGYYDVRGGYSVYFDSLARSNLQNKIVRLCVTARLKPASTSRSSEFLLDTDRSGGPYANLIFTKSESTKCTLGATIRTSDTYTPKIVNFTGSEFDLKNIQWQYYEFPPSARPR